MTTIDSLKIGARAQVIGFGQMPLSFRNRLYGLGLHNGVEFSVAHIAPFGCPVALQVGNTLLSVRLEEMNQLQLNIL